LHDGVVVWLYLCRCTWKHQCYLFKWNVICGRMGTEPLYFQMEHAPVGIYQLFVFLICAMNLFINSLGNLSFLTIQQWPLPEVWVD